MSEPKPVMSDEEIHRIAGTGWSEPLASGNVVVFARRLLAVFAERVALRFEQECSQDDACDPLDSGGCRYANQLREAAKGDDRG